MSNPATQYEESRAAVAGGVEALEEALKALSKAMSSADMEINVQGVGEKRRAVRQVCASYRALETLDDDEGEGDDGVLGVVGVPADVLARAKAVNAAKDRLKEVCKPLATRRKELPVTDEEGNTEVRVFYWMKLILEDIGRPKLNLMRAYRHIPILAARPLRVGYVNTISRSVYRRDKEELIHRLSRSRAEGAEEDIARLLALPGRERFLMEERNSHASVRANVLTEVKDSARNERKMIQARMPILYPLGRGGNPPVVSYPGESGPAYNADYVRARKTQADAYLDTLRVYRYLNPADSR